MKVTTEMIVKELEWVYGRAGFIEKKKNKKIKKIMVNLDFLKTGKEWMSSDLTLLLESDVPQEWVKKAPGTNVPYLPIDKVDYLLRNVYVASWSEVVDMVINQFSANVVLRLFVKLENGRIEHVDGVGSASSKTGIDQALPIAESNAKKNAAKKLGKIFGRDLSREGEEKAKVEALVEKAEIEIDTKVGVDFNPVVDRITKQLEKTKTVKGFSALLKALDVNAEEGQISNSEFEVLIRSIEFKMKCLGFKL